MLTCLQLIMYVNCTLPVHEPYLHMHLRTYSIQYDSMNSCVAHSHVVLCCSVILQFLNFWGRHSCGLTISHNHWPGMCGSFLGCFRSMQLQPKHYGLVSCRHVSPGSGLKGTFDNESVLVKFNPRRRLM